MNLPELLQQTIQNPVLRWFYYGPLALIVLDVLTGIGSAVIRKVFLWKRVADFLDTDLLKYAMVSVIVAICYLAGGISQATTLASALGMIGLSIHIIASIRTNILEIIGVTTLAPLSQVIDDATTPVMQAVGTNASTPQQVPLPDLPIERQSTMITPAIPPALRLPANSNPPLSTSLGVTSTLKEMDLSRSFQQPNTLFPEKL